MPYQRPRERVIRLQDISHHRRFAPQDVSHPSSRRFAPVAVTICLSLGRFAPLWDVSHPRKTFRPLCETFRPLCETFRPLLRRFAPYWDVSPPRKDVSTPGKDVSPPLKKIKLDRSWSLITSGTYRVKIITKQTRDVCPMFDECWPSIADGGPALGQPWVNVTCVLGRQGGLPPARKRLCTNVGLMHCTVVFT